MPDWRNRIGAQDAKAIEARTAAGHDLIAAAQALAHSQYAYVIVRPLGSTPAAAPGVAIGERSHLGLAKAMNRARDLYPDTAAWELVASDRKASANLDRPSMLRSGELQLLASIVLARIGGNT